MKSQSILGTFAPSNWVHTVTKAMAGKHVFRLTQRKAVNGDLRFQDVKSICLIVWFGLVATIGAFIKMENSSRCDEMRILA